MCIYTHLFIYGFVHLCASVCVFMFIAILCDDVCVRPKKHAVYEVIVWPRFPSFFFPKTFSLLPRLSFSTHRCSCYYCRCCVEISVICCCWLCQRKITKVSSFLFRFYTLSLILLNYLFSPIHNSNKIKKEI